MKSRTYQNALLAVVAAVVAVAALAQNRSLAGAPAGKVIIGLVPPQTQAGPGGAGVDLSAPVHQSLISQLQGAGFDVVPLESRDASQVDAEAAAKHASYVLYTRVEQKHASNVSGIGGMLHKLSPLTSMLPLVGGRGGGLAGAASSLAQGAAGATAAAAQQQAMAHMSGAQQSAAGIKAGDTVLIEYRLVTPGSTAVLSSATLQGNAKADGEDVMSPLVGQLASTVTTVMRSGTSGGVLPQSGLQTRSTGQESAGADARGKHSLLGGLFSRHDTVANKPSTSAGNGAIDCATLASMPNAPMSRESCEQLKSTQQAYNQAAADPSASHPGDEQMSCDQITAELRQQQYTAMDKSKVAAAQATGNEHQAMYKREYANMVKMQAEDQAAVNAASAADTATEVSTAGLLRGRALEATEKALDARHNANNERVIKEGAPLERKSVGQVADFSSSMAQQLQQNPRLARLLQLANTKGCKGGQ